MKKKMVSLVLAVAMGLSLLTGCGSDGTDAAGNSETSSKAGDKPTLTVSVFAQEHEQAMYKEVIAKFEEEKNCTVNFQVAGDQYWPELEAALTANTEPDVFYLGIGDIKKRVWSDKVTPMNDLLDVESLNTIWPEALNLYKYDVDRKSVV